MARKVQVVLEDDLHGGEAAETVHFALDGKSYEIDLSDKNAAALRKDLEQWVAAARRAGRASATPAAAKSGSSRRSGEALAIRKWAQDNGIEVSSRGRISAELRAKYLAAQ
ncbi:MAG: histone-like nucleoid-structuring protein Lsr2 [Candidatus Nanopelagicales bacterium]